MVDSAVDVFRAASNEAPPPNDDVSASRPDIFADEPSPSLDAQPEPAPKPEPVRDDAKPDAMVPSWRLRELNEQREAERRERAAEQRELAELRAERERREKAAKPTPDFFEDHDGFLNDRFDQRLTPLQQQMQMIERSQREQAATFSRMMAVQVHGEEKVNAALADLTKEAQAGDPYAAQVAQRVLGGHSVTPFADIMDWHSRATTFREVGNDPKAYRQKILDEAMSDPAFLQKVMESQRENARPIIERAQPASRVTSLPSLNRTSGSPDEDEPEDASAAYRQAARPARRA